MARKAPTLNDVAASAGVSMYTASVVLNGSRSNTRVSENTRQRIVEAAQRLRYHPNMAARGLIHRRTHAIGVFFGVVSSDGVITNPYASGVLQGILAACAEAAYCVTLYTFGWQDDARSAMRFRDGRCDGLILIAPPADSDIVPALAALGLNLCAVAYPAEAYGVHAVDVDNARGIELAVQHLIGLGHRRIAHVTGNPNMASVPIRKQAFCDAMRAAGLSIPEAYIQQGRYDGWETDQVIRRLLDLPEPPTAIVAGNDTIAIAALTVARELNVRVPDDLSLVGFDDAPGAALLTPPLTTVRQPLPRIGEKAARLLIAQIEGESAPAHAHLLEPELVVRGSAARLA